MVSHWYVHLAQYYRKAHKADNQFMVACEETLSGYSVSCFWPPDGNMMQRKLTMSQRAVDFFQALCNMTSGVMLPLMTADMLAMTIVGSVLENMDMERLIGGKYPI